MEFDFDINKVLREPISLISGSEIQKRRFETHAEIAEIIDTVGIRSARAQKLSAPITSWTKLMINNHRVYILTDRTPSSKGTAVIGFIKVGVKQLFVLDYEGKHRQTHPLCVLDFYVHESQQRKGYGLKLFKHMLQTEHVNPSHLAVDRPSIKFTSFLRKHFNLWATIPQVNNFVVFEGFFKNRNDSAGKMRRNYVNKIYDDFRPLSRGFTDGNLAQVQQNYSSNDLNHIRPFSGTRGSTNHFTQSHNQNSRINNFSRYAEENNFIPSPAERRRKILKSRQEEEIVANPYRDTQNCKTRNIDNARIAGAKISDFKKENTPSPDFDTDANPNEKIKFNRYHSDNSGSSSSNGDRYQLNQGKKNLQNSVSEEIDRSSSGGNQSSHERGKKELFEAKTGFNSLRNQRYSHPSDMIDELKKKDKEVANRGISRFHRYALQSSSWNIFGIPTPTQYSKR